MDIKRLDLVLPLANPRLFLVVSVSFHQVEILLKIFSCDTIDQASDADSNLAINAGLIVGWRWANQGLAICRVKRRLGSLVRFIIEGNHLRKPPCQTLNNTLSSALVVIRT